MFRGRQLAVLHYNYTMARIILTALLLAAGCECVPGDEMCAGKYYHMICVDSPQGGNWELLENCLDS